MLFVRLPFSWSASSKVLLVYGRLEFNLEFFVESIIAFRVIVKHRHASEYSSNFRGF